MKRKISKVVSRITIAICFIAMITPLTTSADIYRKTQQNKGSNGYKTVDQIDNTTTGEHLLRCKDPGNIECKWDPVPPGPIEGLFDYADDQIESGVLSGSYTETDDTTRYELTWNATDPNNINVTVETFDLSGPGGQ
jgi:hypothetical protein